MVSQAHARQTGRRDPSAHQKEQAKTKRVRPKERRWINLSLDRVTYSSG